MGAYEDQPGHVEVVEQEPPPVITNADGSAAVPGMPGATEAPENTAVPNDPEAAAKD